MVNPLVKKYLKNNLRVLAMIYKLSKRNGFTYYSEIETYLNRGRNQVSFILAKLEVDKLIRRERDKRPQKIILTNTGEELLKTILNELN
ncbi:hypothetical protein LCGC14_2152070 [marine sediment metagenome]|uniref:HTH marR-type domain-containing protein n=1 Tax=marine sediment metagenome TaxID=412755 RepID=A0A0F9DV55_9ZZZZ